MEFSLKFFFEQSLASSVQHHNNHRRSEANSLFTIAWLLHLSRHNLLTISTDKCFNKLHQIRFHKIQTSTHMWLVEFFSFHLYKQLRRCLQTAILVRTESGKLSVVDAEASGLINESIAVSYPSLKKFFSDYKSNILSNCLSIERMKIHLWAAKSNAFSEVIETKPRTKRLKVLFLLKNTSSWWKPYNFFEVFVMKIVFLKKKISFLFVESRKYLKCHWQSVGWKTQGKHHENVSPTHNSDF